MRLNKESDSDEVWDEAWDGEKWDAMMVDVISGFGFDSYGEDTDGTTYAKALETEGRKGMLKRLAHTTRKRK